MVTGVAMLAGSIGGAAIGSYSLDIPYVVRAAVLGVSFCVAWATMHDAGFVPRTVDLGKVPEEMRRVARESLAASWASLPLRWLIGVRLVQWSFLMWAWYAWQPWFLELWGDPGAVWLAGVVAALMSVAMIAGNALVDWLTRYCGRRTTLMAWAMGAEVVLALVIGLVHEFWVVAPCFLLLIATAGVTGPLRSTSIHKLVSKENRASVLSFDSMVSSGGSMVGQSGLGWLSRAVSIPAGFVVGGLFSLVGLPVLWALRRLNDDSDKIVGERARDLGTCAAQGTPAIGQIAD
jgi:hypothetical protein